MSNSSVSMTAVYTFLVDSTFRSNLEGFPGAFAALEVPCFWAALARV